MPSSPKGVSQQKARGVWFPTARPRWTWCVSTTRTFLSLICVYRVAAYWNPTINLDVIHSILPDILILVHIPLIGFLVIAKAYLFVGSFNL